MVEEKTCLNCKNKKCYIVYGIPADKKKDVKEHHENYDYDVIEFVNECQFEMIEYWKYCDLPKELE